MKLHLIFVLLLMATIIRADDDSDDSDSSSGHKKQKNHSGDGDDDSDSDSGSDSGESGESHNNGGGGSNSTAGRIPSTCGWLKGKHECSNSNPNIYHTAYRGIPYANPPVGNLRFKEPQACNNPDALLDCTRYKSDCMQYAYFPPDPSNSSSGISGSEDCLYLNVFVPDKIKNDTSKKYPVIVWFHDGDWVCGSAQEFCPDHLIDSETVIVITLNWRLSVYGYLTSGDGTIPGNIGSKDQLLALKWIKQNVGNFNGDPNSITLAGHGSGAACVDILSLSGKAEGYYNRIIAHSSSSLSPSAVIYDPKPTYQAYIQALGVQGRSSSQVLQYLQSADATHLLLIAKQTFPTATYIEGYQGFHPCVEKDGNPNAVLTQTPYTIYESGNFTGVPYLSGYNAEEGTCQMLAIQRNQITQSQYTQQMFIPANMYNANITQDTYGKIHKRIQLHYGIDETNIRTDERFLKYASDKNCIYGVRKALNYRSTKNNNCYSYVFQYGGGDKSCSFYGGPAHGQELQFLGNYNAYAIGLGNLTSSHPTQEDIAVRNQMVTLWTSFAQGSYVQSCTWPTVKPGSSYPSLIINNKLTVDETIDQDSYDFWEGIKQTCCNC